MCHFGEDLLKHYKALPKSPSGVPFRSDIMPSQFRNLVPWCMMVILKDQYCLEVSLCGSAIENSCGLKMDGLNLFDVYPADEVKKYAQIFQMIKKRPFGLVCTRVISSKKMPEKEVNIIKLPLSNKRGEIDRMIVLVDTIEPASTDVLKDLGDKSELRINKTLALKAFDLGYGIPDVEYLAPIVR